MSPTWTLLLLAVVGGWIVQLFLSYRQCMAFNDEVRRLRRSGTVSVGSGGRRYRGGRAFVAIAVDQDDVVREALSMRGFTTFARARPKADLIGTPARVLRGEREVPALGRAEREAARQAAELLHLARTTPQTPGTTTRATRTTTPTRAA